MTCRKIYFKITAAEPIKEVVYSYLTSKNVFPQLYGVVSSA